MILQATLGEPLQLDVPSNALVQLDEIPDDCDHVPVIDGAAFTAFEPGRYVLAIIGHADGEIPSPLTIEVATR